MEARKQKLVRIARALAQKPFHGKLMGLSSNIDPLTDHFLDGPRKEFDGKWCAAFVYHCCIQAGFKIPYRYPAKDFGTFAGVRAWLQWAKLRETRYYHSSRNLEFSPRPGDIVVFDNLFDPGPHDHIGIVLAVDSQTLQIAEGNVNNISIVTSRSRNSHIRGYIRIPDNYMHVPPGEVRDDQ